MSLDTTTIAPPPSRLRKILTSPAIIASGLAATVVLPFHNAINTQIRERVMQGRAVHQLAIVENENANLRQQLHSATNKPTGIVTNLNFSPLLQSR